VFVYGASTRPGAVGRHVHIRQIQKSPLSGVTGDVNAKYAKNSYDNR